ELPECANLLVLSSLPKSILRLFPMAIPLFLPSLYEPGHRLLRASSFLFFCFPHRLNIRFHEARRSCLYPQASSLIFFPERIEETTQNPNLQREFFPVHSTRDN